MNRPATASIDHVAFVELIAKGSAKPRLVADGAGRWQIVVPLRKGLATLVGQRGQPRAYSDPRTAIAYLRALGVTQFVIDAAAYEPKGRPAPAIERTSAPLMKKAEQDYDTWFRREVREGIAEADAGHSRPWEEFEAELRAQIRAAKATAKRAGKGQR